MSVEKCLYCQKCLFCPTVIESVYIFSYCFACLYKLLSEGVYIVLLLVEKCLVYRTVSESVCIVCIEVSVLSYFW